jgi:hypothetical protein
MVTVWESRPLSCRYSSVAVQQKKQCPAARGIADPDRKRHQARGGESPGIIARQGRISVIASECIFFAQSIA